MYEKFNKLVTNLLIENSHPSFNKNMDTDNPYSVSSYKDGSKRVYHKTGNIRYYKNPIDEQGNTYNMGGDLPANESPHLYRHRDDGPAVIRPSKDEHNPVNEYYFNDELHRLDGPAIDYLNDPNSSGFWIHGKQYNKKDYWQIPEIIAFNNLGKNHPHLKDATNILNI